MSNLKCLVLVILCLTSCKNRTSSDASGIKSLTPPAAGSVDSPLETEKVYDALVEVKKTFYGSGAVYSTPYETSSNGEKLPPPISEISTCLGACAPRWPDISCHYYAHLSSYSPVVPNIRACFSNVVRSLNKVVNSPDRTLTYPEAYDYCVYQDFDMVLGRNPEFDPAIIAGNKFRGKKPGVMAWIEDNQRDIFKYLMFSSSNRRAFDSQDQHDVLNKFYGVNLSKKDYGLNDTKDTEECLNKRPKRSDDPPLGMHCRPQPVPKAPAKIDTATTIALGSQHMCLLDSKGAAFCAGDASRGVLGTGVASFDVQITLQPVKGGIEFVDISAADFSTCGLAKDGKAYCWGQKRYGVLGLGQTSADIAQEPTEVLGNLRFKQVLTSKDETCGLTESGHVYCWGYDLISGNQTYAPEQLKQAPVFAEISKGFDTTCGITSAKDAYCWGRGLNGINGNGPIGSSAIPTKVSGDLKFSKIRVGSSHACGISTDGRVYCWGDSKNMGRLKPDLLVPELITWGTKLVDIAVAKEFSCTLNEKGELFCWGQNHHNWLGMGNGIKSVDKPTQIKSAVQFKSIEGGDDHVCGIGIDGFAYCWGKNTFGELGLGDKFTREFPALVLGFF